MSTRTQIVVTIGPSSADVALIQAMIAHGMDVARINFSHGTHESSGTYIAAVRTAARATDRHIPIIQDLSGPRAQTDNGHSFDSAKQEITEKDLTDLEFGIAQQIDYIAQSYVGTADDVCALRRQIEMRNARIPIIAKIERQSAVDHIDEIIAEADAIMVARGDLASAVPIEELPIIERTIIERCNKARKPVIVATGMLASMVEEIVPARSEVTDIAYAVLSGTDAIMLSDETARGKHPLEAVSEMEKTARYAEDASARREIHAL